MRTALPTEQKMILVVVHNRRHSAGKEGHFRKVHRAARFLSDDGDLFAMVLVLTAADHLGDYGTAHSLSPMAGASLRNAACARASAIEAP
jgi:hypothetical protein